MNNKNALESLAMDLKRVAIGYHRGSPGMAKRFTEEAMKRRKEVDENEVKSYVKTLLQRLDDLFRDNDQQRISEDSLMISTLLQNYTQKIH